MPQSLLLFHRCRFCLLSFGRFSRSFQSLHFCINGHSTCKFCKSGIFEKIYFRFAIKTKVAHYVPINGMPPTYRVGWGIWGFDLLRYSTAPPLGAGLLLKSPINTVSGSMPTRAYLKNQLLITSNEHIFKTMFYGISELCDPPH